MPIGSTEQHGPTGLVGTDALTAEAIGQRLGDKVDAYVAPTISVGMAQHHLGFSGSMTLKPGLAWKQKAPLVISWNLIHPSSY